MTTTTVGRGGGGAAFDDIQSHPQIVGIRALHIRHASVIQFIEATYILANGSTFVGDRHGIGGDEGENHFFEFSDDEVITEVQALGDNGLAYDLTFFTTDSTGITRRYGTHGITYSSFRVQERVIGFYGRSTSSLHAIGFYHTGWFLHVYH